MNGVLVILLVIIVFSAWLSRYLAEYGPPPV